MTGPLDHPVPLKGLSLVLAGMTLGIANFMVVLDVTIANVSVNTIAGGLAVSPSQGTWVITSYSVAEAITVPLTGWLAQRFGAVRVFTLGVICFGLCSLLCGSASSFGVLVALRVAQGLAGGPIMPLSQTLLLRIFPKHMAGAATGLWGMTTVVGPIMGPLLGGILCDSWGWQWIFWINIPVAIICATGAWMMLRTQETHTEKNPIDTVGLGLLIVWVGALQILLDKGNELDWFASTFIDSLACIAAIGFAAFMIWELTAERPIVNLRVFRHRGFTASVVITAMTFGAFFSSVVILPLWLQSDLGYTATWAGRASAFQGCFAVLLSPVVGQLIRYVDARKLIFFGVLVLAGVSLFRSTFDITVPFALIILPQLAMGIGMPFFFIPISVLALSSVDDNETADAAGLNNFARTLSGAFATSLTTTAWENMTSSYRSDIVSSLNDGPSTIESFMNLGMTHSAALSSLERMVESQAQMLAVNHIALITCAAFVFAAFSVWIAPRQTREVDISAAH